MGGQTVIWIGIKGNLTIGKNVRNTNRSFNFGNNRIGDDRQIVIEINSGSIGNLIAFNQ